MIGKIIGTGSYVPEHCMDNNEIATIVETSDAWIRERTGIAARHIANTETTAYMAAQAAKRAIENAGIAPERIELLIVATISPGTVVPCAACEVQKEIGAVNAICFDLNSACTGFLSAYNTAQAYLAAGTVQTALIIGAERLSKLTDWKDRSTCILFGDGAGAAVLKAEEGTAYLPVLHADGARGDVLTCNDEDPYIHMDGQGVFKFAVKQVPLCIEEVLKKNGVDPSEIAYFILHQANLRIIESVAKRLGVDLERFPVNLSQYGNTSSASVPILLDEMYRDGRLQRGQKIVVAAFGGGLTWGADLIVW